MDVLMNLRQLFYQGDFFGPENGKEQRRLAAKHFQLCWKRSETTTANN